MIQKTPPMGWNTWNTFAQDINEELIRTTADTMVSSGLLAAGYNYLVIDDCWALKERDKSTGRLVADPEKFPSGMKAVADYVHSKGLKFGMYSCCGTLTSAGYPSSFEYEFIDAETVASWGGDFLKYDHCYKPDTAPSDLLYRKMGLALANCGRDILFSACSWGVNQTHEWIKSTGAHMWRSTYDIFDSWQKIKEIYDQNIPLQPYNGQGCFNDMDMLVVGMHGKGHVGLSGCTEEEYRTHFSVWAMFNSPLMIGCDIRKMDEDTKNILMNKDVIAVNQDPAGRQPFRAGTYGCDTWVKFLEGGDIAVLIVNPYDSDCRGTLHLTDIGLDVASGRAIKARDLWTGDDLGVIQDELLFPSVKAHSCKFLKCSIVKR